MVDDATLDNPLEEVLLTPFNQADCRAETGPAIRYPLHILQQQAVVGGKVVAIGCITSRMNPRSTPQRLDLQAGVVGKAVESRALVEITRLLTSISLQRIRRFGYLLLNTALARSHQLEPLAQEGLYLAQLVSIIRRKNYFHSCCFGRFENFENFGSFGSAPKNSRFPQFFSPLSSFITCLPASFPSGHRAPSYR